MKTNLFVLFLLAALPLTAAAQGTISTDRPGLGYNPATVGRGTFQVELGLPSAASTADGAWDVQSYSFPAALRFGATDALELRLATSLYDAARSEAGGVSASDGELGFSVVEVGVKWNLAAQAGLDLAVLPTVFLPAEGGDLGVSGVVVAAWSLPNAFGLSTAAGVYAEGGDASGTLVGVLSRALTDRLGGYVEAAAYPSEGAMPIYAGAGLAFVATPDLQLDAHVDRGLDDGADDWLFGAGLSFRLR